MKKAFSFVKKVVMGQVNWVMGHKYAFILLFWPIQTVVYELMRIAFMHVPVVMIHSPLDDKIPFCEWFAIPYYVWYFYIASVLFYTIYHGKREFLRAAFLVIGCTLIPMIFFVIMPNGIEYSMRPDFEALGRDNFCIDLVKGIYAGDSPPRNVMPSIHCSVALAIAMGYTRAESLKGKWLFKLCTWVLSGFICASTVFIKQHSILDVFGGIAMFIIVWIAVEVVERVYNKESLRWKANREAEKTTE